MSVELLPCPHCGASAGVMKAAGVHQASCSDPSCLANGTYATHERAAAAWNNRAPVDMVLHCPKCGEQHVDAPEPENGWTNPPHKSHLCHGCGCVWRPADVPTNGVACAQTTGSADNYSPCEQTVYCARIAELEEQRDRFEASAYNSERERAEEAERSDRFEAERDEAQRFIRAIAALIGDCPNDSVYEGVQALKSDAERYRWLRDSKRVPRDACDGHLAVGPLGGEDLHWNEELDAVIDSAMRAEPKEPRV